ncbi:GDP/GTP exchange factor for ARF [Gurleya vavrai]
MNLAEEEARIKLNYLINTSHREIIKILTESKYSTINLIKKIIYCDKTSNIELSKVFDIANVMISKTKIDTEFALEMTQFKFHRSERDIDLAIMSYFNLLNTINKNLKGDDENIKLYRNEFFGKIITAINNKIVRLYVLRGIYGVLKEFLKEFNFYFDYFMKKRIYKDFLFFTDFVEDFLHYFSEEQCVEIYLDTNFTYHKELILKMRNFNPYLLLSDMINVDFSTNFFLFDCDVLFFNRTKEMISNNSKLFLENCIDCIKDKKTIKTCSFEYLHIGYNLNDINQDISLKDINVRYERILKNKLYKQKIKAAVIDFNENKNLDKLALISKNSFDLLRIANDTNNFKLGSFLGKENNQEQVKLYLETFNFSNQKLLIALRFFLSCFVLPGEMQVMIRILKEFGIKYYNDQLKNLKLIKYSIKKEENAIIQDLHQKDDKLLDDNGNTEPEYTLHKENDVCLLVYSLLMLNTTLHNPNVKVKKNRKAFLGEILRIKFYKEFSEKFISDLYYSIKKQPIEFKNENKFSSENYTIFLKVKEEIKKTEECFFYDYDSKNKYKNVIEDICFECNYFAYDSIIEENYKIFIDNLNKDSALSFSNIDNLIAIFKYFNKFEALKYLYLVLFQTCNFDYFEKLFDLFFDIINEMSKNEPENCDYLINENTYIAAEKFNEPNSNNYDDFGLKNSTSKQLYNSIGSNRNFVNKNRNENSSFNIKDYTNEKLHFLDEKTNFFVVPFILFTKMIDNIETENLFLQNKDKNNQETYQRLKNKFIRNTAAINKKYFYYIINTNLKCNENGKSILCDIIMRNCFRIDSILFEKIISHFVNETDFIYDLIFKILELDCKASFQKLIEILFNLNFELDKILLKIVVNNFSFIDHDIYLFYKNFVLQNNTKTNFIIFLHLNKKYCFFDEVCLPYITNYVNRIEKKNDDIKLFFNDFLNDPQKLMTFYVSSINFVNYKVLAKYFVKTHDEIVKCPLTIDNFRDDFEKCLTFILIKDNCINNSDFHHYLLRILKIISSCFLLLVNYPIKNINLILTLKGQTFKTLKKFILVGLKNSISENRFCFCANNHNFNVTLDNFVALLFENKTINSSEIFFYYEKKKNEEINKNKYLSEVDNLAIKEEQNLKKEKKLKVIISIEFIPKKTQDSNEYIEKNTDIEKNDIFDL